MADSTNTAARLSSASNPPPKPLSKLARVSLEQGVGAKTLDDMAMIFRQAAAELRELEGAGHA